MRTIQHVPLIFTLVLHLSAVLQPTQAQSTISSFTIDGGGGTSQSGTNRITGTIGQPDAGALSAGEVQIKGGFWSGISGLPTPTPSVPPTETSTPTFGPTPTPTPTPTEFDFDIGSDPPDGFIDALDLIELISQLKALGIDPHLLLKFIFYWQGEYPPGVKAK